MERIVGKEKKNIDGEIEGKDKKKEKRLWMDRQRVGKVRKEDRNKRQK